MGLPASGKTTWVNAYPERKCLKISLDRYFRKFSMETVLEKYTSNIQDSKKETIIFDGLFLRIKTVKELISYLRKLTKIDIVEIHVWDEDRDSCCWNDRGRRIINSVNTIKNAVYNSQVNLDNFTNENVDYDIKIIHHKVIRKPKWQVFFNENKYITSDNGKFDSSKDWVIGGTTRDCDGNTFPMSPDSEPPTSFEELDELLENLYPKLSIAQYKRIYKECVIVETEDKSDWYSDYTIAFYECDLPKLYALLNEFNSQKKDTSIWVVISKKDNSIINAYSSRKNAVEKTNKDESLRVIKTNLSIN